MYQTIGSVVFDAAGRSRRAIAPPSCRPATARGFQPGFRDALLARGGDHLGRVRIQEQVQLRLVQVLLVADGGGALDLVGVVQHDAQVVDVADAGLRAHGRLAGLDVRAEGALLGLAAMPVVVDLAAAARDGHAPAAALVLVDQHNAVVLALVDRARWATGDTGRVQAVFAQAWQVHHEGVLEGRVHLLLHALGSALSRRGCARRIRRPGRPPSSAPDDLVHLLAGQHRHRARGGRRSRAARSFRCRSRRR